MSMGSDPHGRFSAGRDETADSGKTREDPASTSRRHADGQNGRDRHQAAPPQRLADGRDFQLKPGTRNLCSSMMPSDATPSDAKAHTERPPSRRTVQTLRTSPANVIPVKTRNQPK